MKQPPPIYDLPDEHDDESQRDGEGGLFTLLTGIGFGILLGLALGEIWSLIGAAS